MDFGEGLIDEHGNTHKTNHDEPEWTLYETENTITIIPNNGFDMDRGLSIDKESLKATEHDRGDKVYFVKPPRLIYGLIGILNIHQSFHIIFVSKRNRIIRLEPNELNRPKLVYELQDVDTIQIKANTSLKSQSETNEVIAKIKKYLSLGFFFGINYDLTRSQQNLALLKGQMSSWTSKSKKDKKGSLSQLTCDTKYMWNFNICRDLIVQGIRQQWYVNLIQGYVGAISPDEGAQIMLITRRRWRMGGTRYKARGIDDEGNVANNCETEQIIMSHRHHTKPIPVEKDYGMDQKNGESEQQPEQKRAPQTLLAKKMADQFDVSHIVQTTKLYSFCQLRGSIPVFWEQNGAFDVLISRDVEGTIGPFKKHFQRIAKDYNMGKIFAFNLVAPGKGLENKIHTMYEDMLKEAAFSDKLLEYKHLDFHKECAKNSDPLLDYINDFVYPDHIQTEGIFHCEFQLVQESRVNKVTTRVIQEVKSFQKGVIRTNCVDCLDRTNVTQQLIALKSLNEMVLPNIQQEHLLTQWQEACIYLWAMGGDYVSKEYSGTESVLTQITIKGYQSAFDVVQQKMISGRRFLKQSLTDEFKHECIIQLLGQDLKSQQTSKIYAVDQLAKGFTKDTKNSTFVGLVNLNVNGQLPIDYTSIFGAFQGYEPALPDIMVVGLQAMTSTSIGDSIGKALFSKTRERKTAWRDLIQQCLNKLVASQPDAGDAAYIFKQSKGMNGTRIFLFCRKRIDKRIKEMDMMRIEECEKGFAKNKGAVACRFRVDETTFCFLNVHLARGKGNVVQRVENLEEIRAKCFTLCKIQAEVCFNNLVFMFGTMHFGNNLTNGQARLFLNENRMAEFRDHDELLAVRTLRDPESQILKNISLGFSRGESLKHRSLSQFLDTLSEGDLNKDNQGFFYPSYKFDKGAPSYDSKQNKKQRVPSFADRILYMANPMVIKQIRYDTLPHVATFSTHRPVVAGFQCFTIKKNMEAVAQNLMEAQSEFYREEAGFHSPRLQILNSEKIKNLQKRVEEAEEEEKMLDIKDVQQLFTNTVTTVTSVVPKHEKRDTIQDPLFLAIQKKVKKKNDELNAQIAEEEKAKMIEDIAEIQNQEYEAKYQGYNEVDFENGLEFEVAEINAEGKPTTVKGSFATLMEQEQREGSQIQMGQSVIDFQPEQQRASEAVKQQDQMKSVSVLLDEMEINKSVNRGTNQSIMQKSVVENSALERSVLEKSVLEKSILEKSAQEMSMMQKSQVQQSALDQSVLQKSVLEQSVLQKSAVDQSVLEKSIVNEEPAQQQNFAKQSFMDSSFIRKTVIKQSGVLDSAISVIQPEIKEEVEVPKVESLRDQNKKAIEEYVKKVDTAQDIEDKQAYRNAMYAMDDLSDSEEEFLAAQQHQQKVLQTGSEFHEHFASPKYDNDFHISFAVDPDFDAHVDF